MNEETPGDEGDEGYNQGAFLDDTTTDIEKFLTHKQDEDGTPSKDASPEPKRKLNFAMISSFMNRKEADSSDSTNALGDTMQSNGIGKNYD